MKRRIKKAYVKFLSLVPKGANQLPTIYKADDKGQCAFDAQLLLKNGMTDQGELTALVYVPEFRDSQGDIASADVIKEALYNSARDGLDVDIRHNCKPLEKAKAFIAENFIVQKSDPRFTDLKDYSGNPVDATGGWGVVIKIEDEDLRAKYRAGEWGGISMGGVADLLVEKEQSAEIAQEVLKAMKSNINFKNLWISGDIEMTPEELKAIVTQTTEAIRGSMTVTLKEALPAVLKEMGVATTPAPVTPEKKQETVLKFEGEPTAENLAAFRKKVAVQKITDGIDWTDPESINKAELELKKLETPAKAEPELTDEEAGISKEDTAEVKQLKIQLAKAERRSNQPAGEQNPNLDPIEKEMQDDCALGSKMAKAMNQQRGFEPVK